jgi:serine/threonine protein kinase/WD40 repeat protein
LIRSDAGFLRRIGDYELLEEIARGGMGVVYRARQISLNREVAVKLMRDSALARAEDVKRFRAEAAAAAKLKHPNIIAIYEVGEEQGQHYFAMDLIQGVNLAERTRDGPLAARDAAELVATMADAVQHAHEQGVLHRDLKPSNVLVDATGKPFVTDFGLARPLDSDSSLTMTGQILGTPGYMPPEQAEGKGTVGPAADIYSLGAVLYHLLTGRAPFVGGSAAETLRHVTEQEPVSPQLLNPEVPADLTSVCLKCLAKRSSDRYESAAALSNDLHRFLRDEPTVARPASQTERLWRWCQRKPALAATGIALILVGAIGVIGILAEWRRAEAESLKFQSRSYVADMDLANRALEENDLGTAQALLRRYWPGPHETDLRNWEWRYLANLAGGNPHVSLVAHPAQVRSLHFLDNDTLLTASSADWRIVLWNLKERRPSRNITNPRMGGGVSEVTALAHGRNMLFFRGQWGRASEVTVVDLQSGKETNLRDAHAPIVSLDISPDEKVLAIASANQVRLLDVDGKKWLDSFQTESGAAIRGLFSPDGSMLVVADESGRLAFWNLSAHTKLGGLTNAPGNLGILRFSRDGQWLVNPGGNLPTQIWSAKERTLVRELRDSAFVERAVFSADGRWLATAGGDTTIRLWETSRWKKFRTFRGHTDSITTADFSPNGHFLATGARNGEVKLWAMDEPPTASERVSFPPAEFFDLAGDGGGFGRVLKLVESNGVASWTGEAWTTTPLQRSFTTALPAGPPRSGVVLAGSRGAVLGGLDGSIRVVGPLVGQEIIVTNAHKREVYLMDASMDGSTLATKELDYSDNAQVRIWRLPRLEPIAALPHAQHVHGIKLSDDGKLLAGFTGPGDVGVWEIPSMKGPPMWRGIASIQDIRACAFSPDNRWLAAATSDGGAYLWDLATHRRIVLPRALTEYHSLSFSRDGSRLGAGSEGESKLFDTASGQTVLSFKERGLKLAFARDGERLLAVHREGAFVFHAPSFENLQFNWLKERPSQEPPPYLGPDTNYARPDRP